MVSGNLIEQAFEEAPSCPLLEARSVPPSREPVQQVVESFAHALVQSGMAAEEQRQQFADTDGGDGPMTILALT